MTSMKDIYQNADWKTEKHVPVIELPLNPVKGQPLEISVSVGKQLPHPNSSEHHIVWIELYFLAEGEKFPVQLFKAEFSAHGASSQGPNTSTIYTVPSAKVYFKTDKPGVLIAGAYCNIHGLWDNSLALTFSR